MMLKVADKVSAGYLRFRSLLIPFKKDAYKYGIKLALISFFGGEGCGGKNPCALR